MKKINSKTIECIIAAIILAAITLLAWLLTWEVLLMITVISCAALVVFGIMASIFNDSSDNSYRRIGCSENSFQALKKEMEQYDSLTRIMGMLAILALIVFIPSLMAFIITMVIAIVM